MITLFNQFESEIQKPLTALHNDITTQRIDMYEAVSQFYHHLKEVLSLVLESFYGSKKMLVAVDRIFKAAILKVDQNSLAFSLALYADY